MNILRALFVWNLVYIKSLDTKIGKLRPVHINNRQSTVFQLDFRLNRHSLQRQFLLDLFILTTFILDLRFEIQNIRMIWARSGDLTFVQMLTSLFLSNTTHPWQCYISAALRDAEQQSAILKGKKNVLRTQEVFNILHIPPINRKTSGESVILKCNGACSTVTISPVDLDFRFEM